MVERVAVNHQVGSSNLSSGANQKRFPWGAFFGFVEGELSELARMRRSSSGMSGLLATAKQFAKTGGKSCSKVRAVVDPVFKKDDGIFSAKAKFGTARRHIITKADEWKSKS